MRFLLELLRIIILFLLIGGIASNIITNIYSNFDINIDSYIWFIHTAIFLSFFVLYRNKLQFSGWYVGKGREKLPETVSAVLICSSILLLTIPPIFI
ncbi:hypothetical protein [Priestia taiwanensis]|uniref:Uncharacterized protein n=1 Tax=Priestia taiwanensis TaxID=1347902 RepID=A0A917ENJ1_9BACI|nr:hypothetical protein [Priestia taiwanensis]MBM7362205.1 hypothetical protein [Priestia taiwanensis]GGE60234.1 hypothetical protein GCM10007140_08270 [Priestia taiwanensis]